MKKFLYIIFTFCLFSFASCQEKFIDYTGGDRLNFVQKNSSDTLDAYSFLHDPASVQTHTFWIEISTMGDLSSQARQIQLKQVPVDSVDNAVSGVHYVAFDDPQVRDLYVIPAGKVTARIPIIALRDPSLKTTEVTLQLTFDNNDFFAVGYPTKTFRTLKIADKLVKPTLWDNVTINSYILGGTFVSGRVFGAEYGAVKHQFMEDVTGRAIDNDFFQELLDSNDSDYYSYLNSWFKEKLAEKNAELAALGHPPLTEDDGRIVKF